MEDCLFCKIIAGAIPAKKAYEDEEVVVFSDIDPKAPHHYLCVLKTHFKYLSEMDDEKEAMLGRLFRKIPKIAKDLGFSDNYRLVINQGDDAGQSVGHLHVHLLAGKKMEWNPA